MNIFKIFDLDGSCIDSSHRQNTRPDGTLDLDAWREKSTAELVALDSELPLATEFRNALREPNVKVLILTARVLKDPDYAWLLDHGLLANLTLSRPDGCNTPDAELKEIQLRLYADSQGITWANFCKHSMMWDDSNSVIDRLRGIGINVFDATYWNKAKS